MKILNSVQEVWNYCLFCPVCQKSCRTIQVSVGPDDAFTISSFDKSDKDLLLRCVFRYRRIKYSVEYLVDVENNSFEIESQKIDDGFDNHQDIDVDKAKRALFYFYIQSHCKLCNGASSFSSDIEFDLFTRTVSNFGIERESYYIKNENTKFHITLLHDRNVMIFSSANVSKDGLIEIYGKPIELPLLNLDFSNTDKIINRIKTLILFS